MTARLLADIKALKAHIRQLDDNTVAAEVLVLLDRVLELRA